MTDIEDLIKLHSLACEEGKDNFPHPDTGFLVMTRVFLNKRKCCGNKCTFCPYSHINVKNHTCDDNCI